MTAVFQLENIRHCYKANLPAVAIDAFSIAPQSIIGMIGPNGSGKSTLLRLISCVEKPTEGQIFFKGTPVGPFSSAIRFRVTMLPQDPYLMKRTVFQNIAYGLSIQKKQRDIHTAASEALAQVGLDPACFLDRRWYELSGGETQRVALAARLALKPEVLLLDEPTASVDAASIHQIKNAVLHAKNQWGAAVIIASHDWEWLDELCDEVRHMFHGRILGLGKKNIVFGPWDTGENQLFLKILEDGQQLIVSRPPEAQSIAIFNPEDFRITEADSRNREKPLLKVVITRLSLEYATQKTIATCRAGHLNLSVAVQNGDRYAPGQTVWIDYQPDAVNWIS